MKFSLITPTNSIKYLNYLYSSILAQTYTEWEWVIYFNKVSLGDVQLIQSSFKDERVRFINGISSSKIGEIKKAAFDHGTGDILCEVDHDDILAPNCLEELNKVYESNPDVGFVYSDDAILDETTNKSFYPYNPKFGWKYKNVVINGSTYISMNSFDPSASTFSVIYYQPDHIRTWRKEVYDKLGGHNPSYEILDDQELLCRTYLGTKCYHIPEALYIYRYHDTNSYKAKSDKISTLAPAIQFEYMERLVRKELEGSNKLMVDIGGGINPHGGLISVDKVGGQINCDLDGDWSLPNDSVGFAYASHVFEHLRDPLHTMSELYRILCDGGYAYVEVPSTDGRGAFQDPTHVSYWNSNSFWYYTRESHNKYIRHYSGKVIKFRELFRDNVTWDDNVVVTRVWLQAIKSDAYRCGLCDIKV